MVKVHGDRLQNKHFFFSLSSSYSLPPSHKEFVLTTEQTTETNETENKNEK